MDQDFADEGMEGHRTGNSTKMSILHQNIQCLRNKVDEVDIFINGMEMKPEIICFTETWLKAEEADFIKIEGYEKRACFCRVEMQHGGASIFSKESTMVEPVDEIKKLTIEGQIECVAVKSVSNKLLVVCIYRTNLGDSNIFMARLEELLLYIQKHFKFYDIAICGDFNVNLFHQNILTSSFLDLLNSFNLKQTIFQATRVTKQTNSLIDNIFVNFNIENGVVVDSALSDHHAQIICFNKEVKKVVMEKPGKRRFFSEAKLEQYRLELLSETWENILVVNNVDEAYDAFIGKIIATMNRVIGLKTIQTSKQKRKSWLTTGIKKSCETKKKLQEGVRNGWVDNDYLKKYTSVLQRVCRKAKLEQNTQYILSAENKCKASWALVNKIMKKSSKSSDIFENFNENRNKENLLNNINHYFINACPDVDKNQPYDMSHIKSISKSIFMSFVSVEEVIKCIRNLKNKKSVGEDEIPVVLLKKVADLISLPLAHIINLMFDTGVFPDRLKIAHIKTIFKNKGERDNLGNYRPISVLSNISKIVEKIINDRLISFLDGNNVINECQFGFRKERSTTQAVYQAVVEVIDSMNDRKKTLAVCLDLSKAFDSVDHSLLIRKLNAYGIRGKASDLLSSYLSNRRQRVVEIEKSGNIIKSEIIQVKKGVPQGSILGPLLYLLYTNEITEVSQEHLILYADDTSMIISENSWNEATERACETMRVLQGWFQDNNLLMNVNKTQVINFDRTGADLRLELGGVEMSSAQSVSFLGVTLDRRLDWSAHIEILSQTISRFCYALRVVRDNVGVDAAINAYHAFVVSRLRYGIIFWGNASEVHRVLILQKRCLRTIFNLNRRKSCVPIFKEKQLLTVVSLYLFEGIKFYCENKVLFEDRRRKHHYNTRTKADLLLDKTSFSYIQKESRNSLIKIWNHLPSQMRELPKRSLLCQVLRYLKDNPFYCLDEFFESVIM